MSRRPKATSPRVAGRCGGISNVTRDKVEAARESLERLKAEAAPADE